MSAQVHIPGPGHNRSPCAQRSSPLPLGCSQPRGTKRRYCLSGGLTQKHQCEVSTRYVGTQSRHLLQRLSNCRTCRTLSTAPRASTGASNSSGTMRAASPHQVVSSTGIMLSRQKVQCLKAHTCSCKRVQRLGQLRDVVSRERWYPDPGNFCEGRGRQAVAYASNLFNAQQIEKAGYEGRP